jgi:hypothetical protein
VLVFVAWLNVAVQQSVVQAARELLVPGGEWLSFEVMFVQSEFESGLLLCCGQAVRQLQR